MNLLNATFTSAALLTALAMGAISHADSTEQKAVGENKKICAASTSLPVRRLSSQVTEDFCTTYQGKVVLVVNTASRCAYTDQYDGLEKLYSRYHKQGFEIAGFPSNNFAGQEPGTEAQIREFCRLTYGVKFPMYAKGDVIGDNAQPIYRALARAAQQQPKWNFHKYLIDRNGTLVQSFNPSVEPDDPELKIRIEALF